MIVPMIFTLDPVYEYLSQTWTFYKAVSFCKKHRWPVIAQEQYFVQWDKQNRIFPQFFSKDLCDMFEYDVPGKADLSKIQQVCIPKWIETNFVKKYRTQSDAYMASFRENWPEMENFLCDELQKIQESNGERVEAITSLTYVKFLQNVSSRTGIPVIYYEWGPFRYSSYRNTAFFDIDGKFKNIFPLFDEFRRKSGFENIPVLTKKEILALLLKEDYLKYIEKNAEDNPEFDHYEVGIIGGYNSLTETSSYTYLNMVEIYNAVKSVFSENEIAVRYHPGDPIHAKMNVQNEKTGELIDFILSCKRIACISSNVEVEAMLYGKAVYDMGQFKFDGMVNRNLQEQTGRKNSDEEINFITFVCVIPFELLNSVEYIRFRLNNPDLREIYLYHLHYYFDSLGIPYQVLEGSDEDRMKAILNYRHSCTEIDCSFKKNPGELDLYKKIQIYKHNLDVVQQQFLTMRQQVLAMQQEIELLKEEKEQTQQRRIEIEHKLQECLIQKENLENLLRAESSRNSELQEKVIFANDLEQQLIDVKNSYETVMNSKSMRITKPIRTIVWKAKQINRILKEKA